MGGLLFSRKIVKKIKEKVKRELSNPQTRVKAEENKGNSSKFQVLNDYNKTNTKKKQNREDSSKVRTSTASNSNNKKKINGEDIPRNSSKNSEKTLTTNERKKCFGATKRLCEDSKKTIVYLKKNHVEPNAKKRTDCPQCLFLLRKGFPIKYCDDHH